MNSAERKSRKHPVESSNIISKAFFCWTWDMLKKGYKGTYNVNDLCDPLKNNETSLLGDLLEKNWNKELSRNKPNLIRAMFFTFWRGFFKSVALGLWEIVAKIMIPLVFGLFLHSFIPESKSTLKETMFYGLSFVGLDFMKLFFHYHMYFNAFFVAGQIHAAVASLIYRKAIKLSKTSLNEASPGQIVNLIASEVHRFQFLISNNVNILCTPLCIFIAGVILYNLYGVASVIGLFIVVKVSFMQLLVGNLSVKYRQKATERAGERIQLIDEMVSGIQVMKMYTWEKLFASQVKKAKNTELLLAKKASHFRNASWTFHLIVPRLGIYVAFITVLKLGGIPSVESLFVISTFYFLLNDTLTMTYRGGSDLKDSLAAARKIEAFLLLDETPRSSNNNIEKNIINEYVNKAFESFIKDTKGKLIDCKSNNEFSITMNDLSIAWDREPPKYILENVNLQFEKGKLYLIIGTVGSGKTSLLSSILKEIKVTKGDIQIEGRLSYAGQDNWVFGDTIRQNILFGEPYEHYRYDQVLKACCLMEDFKKFPNGDHSVVGEKGISLSGGQKARINLARAMYRDADIYLLDDPLSAVDAHVSKRLFDNCIQTFLRNKTRILTTHQFHFIKDVDGIVLIENGTTYFYQDYNRLLKEHSEYRDLITIEETKISTNTTNVSSLSMSDNNSMLSRQSMSGNDEVREIDDIIEKTPKNNRTSGLLMAYFKAGSNMSSIVIMFFLFFLTQTIVCLNDFYILIFSAAEESRYRYDHTKDMSDAYRAQLEDKLYPTDAYIEIAITLLMLIIMVGLIRSIFFDNLCLRSSKNLHNSALDALISTKLRFFHTNPSGRILNRFSKDITIVDELLPLSLIDSFQIFFLAASVYIIICTIEPFFLIPVIAITGLCYWLRQIFLESCVPINRLDGAIKAPLFTQLNETLNGITAVRAFQAENFLINEFDKLLDLQFSSWYNTMSCKFALGFLLKIFLNLFVLIIICFFAFFKKSFYNGEVGLAILQVFTLTNILIYGSGVCSDVANFLKSVERLLEYAELPRESDNELHEKRQKFECSALVPPKNWPENGVIEFQNVTMRYSLDDRPVLKSLNFRIEPQQKIGIVGRTGAGKSSLISALFRLSEIDGIIKIDKIDTGLISLTALRSRISIIPQDPVLFSGTLRQNLDPFNEYSDNELWNVLEQVELKKTVCLEIAGLEYKVHDKGANYSIGQKQLICLARAMLRKNRILVLDEATANVDPHTDLLIQETIRDKFKWCTVLTVAHRLNTIIDSDKVIVMDNGYLVEFDHPYELLQNETGYFTKLVKEIGDATYQQFVKISKLSYKKNV